jgi:hypothetical protein
MDQGRERGFIAPCGKPLEQLTVAHRAGLVRGRSPVQEMHQGVAAFVTHQLSSRNRESPPHGTARQSRGGYTFFAELRNLGERGV